MSANDEGSYWDGDWQIVRSDLDLAHVFAPQDTISFIRTPTGDGYTVVHKSTALAAGYLTNVVLTEVGNVAPAFNSISDDHALPQFSSQYKDRYRTLADRLEQFAQKKAAGVRRLEGKLRIPCHSFGYQHQESEVDAHDSQLIEATIQVYQFANVVEDGDKPKRRLLAIYKPIEPSCTNGNGTVLGYD